MDGGMDITNIVTINFKREAVSLSDLYISQTSAKMVFKCDKMVQVWNHVVERVAPAF